MYYVCLYVHIITHLDTQVTGCKCGGKRQAHFSTLFDSIFCFFHCCLRQPSCPKSFWEFCFVLPWDFWDYNYGLSRFRESRLKSWHLQKYVTCWAILPAPNIHFKCNFESLQILIFSKTSSVVMLVCVHMCLNKLYFLIILFDLLSKLEIIYNFL